MDFDQGNIHLTAGNRVLLGDYGYHAHDSDGSSLPAAGDAATLPRLTRG